MEVAGSEGECRNRGIGALDEVVEGDRTHCVWVVRWAWYRLAVESIFQDHQELAMDRQ